MKERAPSTKWDSSRQLRKVQAGQTMTDYGLILAAVAIVAVVAYATLGTAISTLVNNVVNCL